MMNRTEFLDRVKQMRFEEAYAGWTGSRLTQKEVDNYCADHYISMRNARLALLVCLHSEARAKETVKLSAFHRRISIPPDGGFDVRTGQVTAKEGMMW